MEPCAVETVKLIRAYLSASDDEITTLFQRDVAPVSSEVFNNLVMLAGAQLRAFAQVVGRSPAEILPEMWARAQTDDPVKGLVQALVTAQALGDADAIDALSDDTVALPYVEIASLLADLVAMLVHSLGDIPGSSVASILAGIERALGI